MEGEIEAWVVGGSIDEGRRKEGRTKRWILREVEGWMEGGKGGRTGGERGGMGWISLPLCVPRLSGK